MSLLTDNLPQHFDRVDVVNTTRPMQATFANLIDEGAETQSELSVEPREGGVEVRMECEMEYKGRITPFPETEKTMLREFHREWLKKQLAFDEGTPFDGTQTP